MTKSLFAVFAVLLTLASCATFDQRVSIAPLRTSFPVSASPSLSVGDKTIDSSQLTDTQPFTLTKTVRVPLSVGQTDLGLTSLLDQELKGSSFNAMTNLKVDVAGVNNSATTFIVLEENLGVGLIAMSTVAFLGATIAETQPGPVGKGPYIGAAVCFSTGMAMFPLAIVHSGFATIDYTFTVSGLKVKY